jgi:uncharacterized protein involved in outer membrane biogenesis
MGTLFKIIAGLILVVVIVVVVGVLNLDRGIKAAVETLGPKYTQADVSLNEVDLSLKTGKGSLRGLTVGNPAGFKTAQAFSLGEITVQVDTSTVTSDVIVIEQIRILAPQITYESGKNGSNLDQLQKNVTAAAGGTGETPGTEQDDSAEKAVKLIIRDLQISDGKLSYSNALLGDKTVDVALPAIQLTNIGEKSGGATSAEVVKQVLAAINRKAGSAIANSADIDKLKSQLQDQFKEKANKAVGDKLKGLFNRD